MDRPSRAMRKHESGVFVAFQTCINHHYFLVVMEWNEMLTWILGSKTFKSVRGSIYSDIWLHKFETTSITSETGFLSCHIQWPFIPKDFFQTKQNFQRFEFSNTKSSTLVIRSNPLEISLKIRLTHYCSPVSKKNISFFPASPIFTPSPLLPSATHHFSALALGRSAAGAEPLEQTLKHLDTN